VQTRIQRPLQRIIEEIGDSAGVFVLGCGDCASREHFGGPDECRELAEQLTDAGITVTGWGAPPEGGSTCNLHVAKALVADHAAEVAAADTVVMLACPQGLEAVSRAVGDRRVVNGIHTIAGDQTAGGAWDVSSCGFCSECIAGLTDGLCPHAYCPKGLLNGPCGGAQGGRCEVFPSRRCVWELIYHRLRRVGRLDVLERYNEPADFGVGRDED